MLRLSSNSTSPVLSENSTSNLLTTLSDLETFNAEEYAKETYSSLAPNHMSLSCFVHFCLAWQIAAQIYTSRVLFTLTTLPPHPVSPLVSRLISHCKVVTTECIGIKCFVWPVFIAGVECEDEDREWVAGALDQFWQLYLGKNVKAVASVLKILWMKKDGRKTEDGEWNWIREIYLLDVDGLLS